MNIRVSGNLLRNKIANISKIFSKSSNNIFSSNIRFLIYRDYLEIQAMNEKITASEKIYDDVIIDLDDRPLSSFLIDASTFISFIKNRVEYIDIKVKDNNDIDFVYPKGCFSTVWLDDKSYPTFFQPVKENVLTVNSKLFVPVLKRSFYFSGKDEFRPFIETALLEISNGFLNVVTTDRFKIFKSSKNIEGANNQNILLSETVSSILYGYLSDEDIDVNISTDGTRTFIWFDNVIISDINVVGKFPNYKFIFDNFISNTSFEVNKKEFISIIQSSSIVEDKFVEINIGPRIEVKSEVIGKRNKFVEYMDCDYFEGNNQKIKVSKSDILACVNNVVGDNLRIEYCEKSRFLRFFNPKYSNELITCCTYA